MDSSDTSAAASPDDITNSRKINLPKIVGIGLHGVLEIIKESQSQFPTICKKALESLLDILQGLQPEELMQEPPSVMDQMFQILLDLASVSGSSSSTVDHTVAGTSSNDGGHIRALASACLLVLTKVVFKMYLLILMSFIVTEFCSCLW